MIVKTDQNEFADYLTDASNIQGGGAEKLFVPESAEEVAEILKQASRDGTPVTVSGARTGTVGGAVPFGGIIVSLERFDAIGEIDRGSMSVLAGAGVILGDLQKAVESAGLYYPPDPTEWSCQIGGTVATNASGSRSFKYGPTRNFVRRLKVVLPTGEIVDLRRGDVVSREGWIYLDAGVGRKVKAKIPTYPKPDSRKNTCGYFSGGDVDAVDLFVGSEGTLGVITEVELGLVEKPYGSLSGIVFFSDKSDLLDLVGAVRESSFEARKGLGGEARVDAALIEYFDRRSLDLIAESFPDVPEGMEGAIFFEQETTEENEDELFDAWNSLLEANNAEIENSWFAVSEQDLQKMRDFRHALPVAVNERVVKNGQRKIGTDMAVSDSGFPSFLRYCEERLETSGIEYVIFGHIGDNHLHINLLPKNDDEAAAARHLYGRFIAYAVMLGGTVSAEHGIGKLKSKYLYVMYGERYLNEMADLKKAFDPNGILGPGNMIDRKYL